MKNEDMKKHIETYKVLQTIPALNMPCPRCGKNKLESELIDNCLSRHEDIYICNECGRDEAGFDFVGQVKPLDKWYAVRFLNGEIGPYERKTPEGIAPYYWVNAHVTAKVTDQDINDIMSAALDGGITGWCGRTEVVGERCGKYASDEISRGGELRLYDMETDEVYTLTLDKFLRGLSQYIGGCYDYVTENGSLDAGQIDAEGADCIIQFALFGDIIYG